MQVKKGRDPLLCKVGDKRERGKWSLSESGSGMIGWRFRGSGCLKTACRTGVSGDDGAVSAIREGQDREDSREAAVRSTTEIGKSRLERCGNRGRTGAMREKKKNLARPCDPVGNLSTECQRCSSGRCYVLGVDDGSSMHASCMCNACPSFLGLSVSAGMRVCPQRYADSPQGRLTRRSQHVSTQEPDPQRSSFPT
jgi:hypothetical protein